MTMGPILTKEQMTEEDIKLQFITPAITTRWPREHITMEQKITDGKINLKGNLVVREKPKKADYVFTINGQLNGIFIELEKRIFGKISLFLFCWNCVTILKRFVCYNLTRTLSVGIDLRQESHEPPQQNTPSAASERDSGGTKKGWNQ